MAKLFLQLTVLYLTIVLSVSKSVHRRSIPDSVYINLVSALCIEDDGSVRNACLQNLSSSLLEAIYSNVNDENKFGKNYTPPNTDLNAFLLKQSAIPEKRGRDRSSGFYSNW